MAAFGRALVQDPLSVLDGSCCKAGNLSASGARVRVISIDHPAIAFLVAVIALALIERSVSRIIPCWRKSGNVNHADESCLGEGRRSAYSEAGMPTNVELETSGSILEPSWDDFGGRLYIVGLS